MFTWTTDYHPCVGGMTRSTLNCSFGVKNYTSLFVIPSIAALGKPKLLATADSFTLSTEGAVEGMFVRGSLTRAEEAEVKMNHQY